MATFGFFSDRMELVFFVYGLAFFAMGLALALESRRSSASVLASSLMYLAAFGLLHSVVEWLDMFLHIQTQGMTLEGSYSLRVARVLLLAASAVCLVQFGTKLTIDTLQRYRWLRWLPLGLLVAWLASFIVPHVSLVPITGQVQADGLCIQCHWGQSGAYLLASRDWLNGADIWSRYLLYFPGSLLAAFALASQRPFFLGLGLPRLARAASWAAAAFGFNAIVAGLVVPPAPYLPASVLNYATFAAVLPVPPQIPRTVAALAIAFFVVRILSVFEIETRRQLERAQEDRFQAQQAALEAQRRAQEEMERWNRDLEDRVRQRTQELEALYKIATEISALLDLDRILASVVDKARGLLGADLTTVCLLDRHTGEIVVRAVSGAHLAAFRTLRFQVGQGMAGKAIASGEPVLVANYTGDPTISHEMDDIITAEGLRSHLAVPLKMGDQVLGALYVAGRQPREFTPAEAGLITRLANHASIAIENARLYEQVQNLAVLEERDRIAREMHDSLAQALGYLSLKAQLVDGFLAAGKLVEAQAELRRMERAADDAYADVRESILGLRSTVSSGRGLLPTLSEYLHKFSFQNGIAADLVVNDGTDIRLAPEAEVQLIRIIQEALTNVRKHAHASRAWVRIDHTGGDTTITVEDDGHGFDPTHVAGRESHHFGLQTMRERAESVGGQLWVDSSPGQGTRVVVRLGSAVVVG